MKHLFVSVFAFHIARTPSQLPLPSHIDERAVLERISLEKDADGLHPLNVGFLALKGYEPKAVACTPKVRVWRL